MVFLDSVSINPRKISNDGRNSVKTRKKTKKNKNSKRSSSNRNNSNDDNNHNSNLSYNDPISRMLLPITIVLATMRIMIRMLRAIMMIIINLSSLPFRLHVNGAPSSKVDPMVL